MTTIVIFGMSTVSKKIFYNTTAQRLYYGIYILKYRIRFYSVESDRQMAAKLDFAYTEMSNVFSGHSFLSGIPDNPVVDAQIIALYCRNTMSGLI